MVKPSDIHAAVYPRHWNYTWGSEPLQSSTLSFAALLEETFMNQY